MTPQRWERTNTYLREVFGREDEHLSGLMGRAVAAGLPEIAVSADVGRLLKMLVAMARAEGTSAERPGIVVEIGTLAGYSGIWLARGLGDKGRLITIESEPKHAAVAAGEFIGAGAAEKVDQIVAAAPACLPSLVQRLGPASVDVLFLDAVKKDYAEYLRILRPCLRVGGLLIADNALGASYWIDDPPGTSADRDAIDAFNRSMARDEQFETICVPMREGVLVARRISA